MCFTFHYWCVGYENGGTLDSPLVDGNDVPSGRGYLSSALVGLKHLMTGLHSTEQHGHLTLQLEKQCMESQDACSNVRPKLRMGRPSVLPPGAGPKRPIVPDRIRP